MIHEFAHSLLHKQTDKNSNQREIEAEFVVSGAVIQTKENTANGYLATMFASAIELIIAVSKKRKLSK